MNARAAFERGPFHVVQARHDADLLWLREPEDYRPCFKTLRPLQLLNHLPSEAAMSDKGHLAEHLYGYDRVQREDDLGVKDLVQETYCLYLRNDRERFFAQVPKEASKDNLWILKRADSARGVGIRILWQFDELREFCARAARPRRGERYARYVIQRYIKNPLLLEGRKSEIRVYWLVASLDPLLVLMYREGTVRLNTQPFKLDDFDNTLIHVTNVAQQKAHPDHDPAAVLKWPFERWERYLVVECKRAPEGYLERHLKPHLKRMLSFVIRAAAPALRVGYPKRGLCFGLYGADIILDDTLHPWLTEVQEGPGLSFTDATKQALIPAVLNEAAAIMLEVARRRRGGESLKTLEAVKGFEWVINEA